jgi:hypothetical protein
MRGLPAILFFVSAVALAPAHAAPGFDWREDSFSFSNDTVLAYGTDESGRLTMHSRREPVGYSHRCFVLARAVMQFHQFARFEPGAQRASGAEYRRLVRKLSRIPAWRAPFPEERRVVIPGYANLRAFSRGHEMLLKQELGNWWPSYLRIGNWRMIFPFPPAGQAAAAGRMIERLDRGDLQAVYLTVFPWMNHCVVLFDHRRMANGDIRFALYDPNYPEQAGALFYRAATRSFDFPKRWYWTGGRVNLLRVYISPLH